MMTFKQEQAAIKKYDAIMYPDKRYLILVSGNVVWTYKANSKAWLRKRVYNLLPVAQAAKKRNQTVSDMVSFAMTLSTLINSPVNISPGIPGARIEIMVDKFGDYRN